MNGTNYEVPHCKAFSIPFLSLLSSFKCPPEDLVLKYLSAILSLESYISSALKFVLIYILCFTQQYSQLPDFYLYKEYIFMLLLIQLFLYFLCK